MLTDEYGNAYANEISAQLAIAKAEGRNGLTQEELDRIIDNAAEAYGSFLIALGVNWREDPNSSDTPRRVAKAYVHDLWRGRFYPEPTITSFKGVKYDGMVFEGGIPVTSMCSHHHQTIMGTAHIAYIPNGSDVIGLSKLNRVVEHYARRGQIQEGLTQDVHDHLSKLIPGNAGIAVTIEAVHNCVQCRGVKHVGASMGTTVLSGGFKDEPSARAEFDQWVTRKMNSRN